MSSPAVAVHDVPMMVRIEGSVPVIELPEHLGFEDLRAWVREQMPLHAEEIGGRASRLDLGRREIKLFDLRRVLNVLRQEFGIDVTGIYVEGNILHRFAERELKLKVFLHEEAPAAPEVDPEEVPTEVMAPEDDALLEAEIAEAEFGEAEVRDTPTEDEVVDEGDGLPDAEKLAGATLPHDLGPDEVDAPSATPAPALRIAAREEPPGARTMSVHRTLRSGASVRFEGDIVLYGDVNPGAHVVATGNIVVLGALKGIAHAGASGDEEAFIMALNLRPTQLRIARKIAVPPERDSGMLPERARIEGDQIVIEPFTSSRRG